MYPGLPFRRTVLRSALVSWKLAQICLTMLGVLLIVGVVDMTTYDAKLIDSLGLAMTDAKGPGERIPAAARSAPGLPSLTPRMRTALDYVSRRYHVSPDALGPVFEAAQLAGQERNIDPLLIIAVVGVESGFNPYSQSPIGAQGLMQVVPRFHMEKLPQDGSGVPLLDPVTNVRVGAQALDEYVRRNGGLIPGLQQYGGAPNDPERTYSAKVLAERERLDQAVRLNREGSA
jgi:soluble lytic murein transglycosylase-like protein